MRMWVLRAHLASTKHRQLGRDPGPCLGLFGPCRCKQHPGLIESTVWLLDHVATVIGLRAVRLREPVKVFGIGHCWPDRKDRPRLPSGGGRTAGAFFGAPKSAVERRRDRQRDRRRFVPPPALMVEVVAPPVVVLAMMTNTNRTSQPDQQACATARRPRGAFPWLPDLARCRPGRRLLWPCGDILLLSVSCQQERLVRAERSVAREILRDGVGCGAARASLRARGYFDSSMTSPGFKLRASSSIGFSLFDNNVAAQPSGTAFKTWSTASSRRQAAAQS